MFASSTLANEQYDWQVIAPKFENVDVKSDIHDFIRSTRGSRGRFHLADLTVNDLCNDTTQSLVTSPSSKPCRPLRKTRLEIRDISSKKVPFDYDGNQEPLREALGTQPRRSGENHGHEDRGARDQEQHPSSRDEYARLRIDCSASSTENDFADTEGDTASVLQATGDGIDGHTEMQAGDKGLAAQQTEPEHDSDGPSPSISPSASSNSLTTHFLNHDREADSSVEQHNSTTAIAEN